MNLSTRQFAMLVKRLEAGPSDPAFLGDNKRRAGRVELKSRATIVPYADGVAGEGVGVEVRNVSPRGIRFLHSKSLARGSQFVLELPQDTGDPVNILCTVVHCQPTEEGPFAVGAEFTCALADGKPQAASASETGGERDRIRQSILD